MEYNSLLNSDYYTAGEQSAVLHLSNPIWPNFVSIVSLKGFLKIPWLIPCHPTLLLWKVLALNECSSADINLSRNPMFLTRIFALIVDHHHIHCTVPLEFPSSLFHLSQKGLHCWAYVIRGQRLVKFAAPGLLITEIQQPGTSSSPSLLKHFSRGVI